jgi:hypothetical protein
MSGGSCDFTPQARELRSSRSSFLAFIQRCRGSLYCSPRGRDLTRRYRFAPRAGRRVWPGPARCALSTLGEQPSASSHGGGERGAGSGGSVWRFLQRHRPQSGPPVKWQKPEQKCSISSFTPPDQQSRATPKSELNGATARSFRPRLRRDDGPSSGDLRPAGNAKYGPSKTEARMAGNSDVTVAIRDGAQRRGRDERPLMAESTPTTSPREEPESGPKVPFHCESEVVSRPKAVFRFRFDRCVGPRRIGCVSREICRLGRKPPVSSCVGCVVESNFRLQNLFEKRTQARLSGSGERRSAGIDFRADPRDMVCKRAAGVKGHPVSNIAP